MKKNFTNQVHLEGILYNHSLEKKVTGENSKHPGTEYIRGSIDIATNDEMTNVVSVYFRYVTAMTSTGKVMPTFGALEKIITLASTAIPIPRRIAAIPGSVKTPFNK